MSRTELNRHRRTLMLGTDPFPGSPSMARLLILTSRTTGVGRHPVAQRMTWLPGAASRSDQQIADMAACARSTWYSQVRGTSAVT